MVELKVKVGNKGQILIPKIFREKYSINEGESVSIEPLTEGLLIKGKPSPEEIMNRLNSHLEKIEKLNIKGSKLGELRKVYLEVEFEEEKA
jgi:AbrB family looped-hinge helix DNA binding protein